MTNKKIFDKLKSLANAKAKACDFNTKFVRKVIVIIFNLLLIFSISNFCHAQTIDENAIAKEIESLKLKIGQLIDHEEITPINFKTQMAGDREIIYSYIGNEVENASSIVFGKNDTYSNTEKLDEKHFRIYIAPKYFKGDDNIIHKIETAKTTTEIWDKANVTTLMDKITNLLKTPYAIAGTSYSTDDGYIARYNNTSWYDVRTSAAGDVKVYDRIIAYNWVQYATEAGDQYFNFRTPLTFDLSLINPANILSGSINLYSEEADETIQHSYAFFKGTQAFPTSINDYSSFINNIYTNTIENSDVLTNAFTSWTLNNDGINYFKTGATDLMFMETMYDVGSTTPPYYLNIENGRSFNSSLSEDFESHPYIELEVSSPTGTTTPIICDFSNTDISKITGCSIKVDSTGTTTTAFTYYSPFILYVFVYGLVFIILFLIYLIYYTFKK